MCENFKYNKCKENQLKIEKIVKILKIGIFIKKGRIYENPALHLPMKNIFPGGNIN